MQCETAGRAGDPSGQGEEPPPEGLGGRHLLTQSDARCRAGQVMRHHPVSSTGQALYRQPGAVGGEAAQLGKSEVVGQGGGKEQPDVGYQAVVVEGDLDAVAVGAW